MRIICRQIVESNYIVESMGEITLLWQLCVQFRKCNLESLLRSKRLCARFPWVINQNTVEDKSWSCPVLIAIKNNAFPSSKLSNQIMISVKNAFCSVWLFTACQSSTDRKGGQAVPSLCNQCWGFCGGPTAIPDYSQNVRTSYYCSVADLISRVRIMSSTATERHPPTPLDRQ